MSIHRYAARTDGNQQDIIYALMAAGCFVEVIRLPTDLLIGRRDRWVLAEVKDPSKRWRYTPAQQRFIGRLVGWRMPFLTLTDPEQAVKAVIEATR